jgi:hypothetical protein
VAHYTVIRDLPNYRDVQMRRGTRAEAEELLGSLRRRWEAVADTGSWNGGPPFTTAIEGGTLTVHHGERVVDRYVIEVAK